MMRMPDYIELRERREDVAREIAKACAPKTPGRVRRLLSRALAAGVHALRAWGGDHRQQATIRQVRWTERPGEGPATVL